jgi:hypothetical protein
MRSALVLVALTACAGDAGRAERARSARYEADRNELVRRTAEEVGKHYGTLSISPDGAIKTAWHQVGSGGTSLERDPGVGGRPDGKWFIRFDITISSERPASIEVSGFAAKWQTGSTTRSSATRSRRRSRSAAARARPVSGGEQPGELARSSAAGTLRRQVTGADRRSQAAARSATRLILSS